MTLLQQSPSKHGSTSTFGRTIRSCPTGPPERCIGLNRRRVPKSSRSDSWRSNCPKSRRLPTECRRQLRRCTRRTPIHAGRICRAAPKSMCGGPDARLSTCARCRLRPSARRPDARCWHWPTSVVRGVVLRQRRGDRSRLVTRSLAYAKRMAAHYGIGNVASCVETSSICLSSAAPSTMSNGGVLHHWAIPVPVCGQFPR